MSWEVRLGDCVEAMAAMPAGSVDAVVCDPPYGLEFMGKEWDAIGTGRKGNPFDPSKSHIVKADGKPDQRAQNEGGTWFGSRAGSAPGGFAPKKMPKCRKCDKWQYNGSPTAQCSCDSPEWVTDTSSYPRKMQEWHEAWSREAFRVLKPGGHLLAFGGSRTYHRLVCAVEDAGFEVRDTISWLYGSGFPKSLDVAKAIDKQERGVPQGGADPSSPHHGEYRTTTTEGKRWDGDSGQGYGAGGSRFLADTASERTALPNDAETADTSRPSTQDATASLTPEAERWQGWGTALAPSHEPVVVARKPLDGTVAATVLKWGTGALNIDGSRVDSDRSTSTMVLCPSNGPAPHVERLSGWLTVESPEAKGRIVLALAATRPGGEPVLLMEIGEAGDSCVRMAMSPSDTARLTSSSIGQSWKDNSAGGSSGGSTFITETATALTTDPAILSFCRSVPTLLTTTRAVTPLGGCECDAWPVVESSSDGGWKWSATPLRIARAPVTALGRWPKNCVLSHSSGCVRVGTRKVKSAGDGGAPRASTDDWRFRPGKGHGDADGMETVESWDCEPSCPVRLLDEQTGEQRAGKPSATGSGFAATGHFPIQNDAPNGYADSGGASRFFPTFEDTRFRYVAKAGRAERNAGLDGFEEKPAQPGSFSDYADATWKNHHPTVKPIELMRWLVRLVTPPGGTVLDPFTGSGSTGCAAVLEGFDFIGIEREPEYADIAEARIGWWAKHRGDGLAAAVLAAGEARDAVEATGQLELDW